MGHNSTYNGLSSLSCFPVIAFHICRIVLESCVEREIMFYKFSLFLKTLIIKVFLMGREDHPISLNKIKFKSATYLLNVMF